MMKPMCNIHFALLGFGFKREKKVENATEKSAKCV